MGRLEGKIAVVTGAAGGLGAAAARRFVAEGAKVMLVDRDAAVLEQAARAAGPADRIACMAADVTDAHAVETYTQAAVERFGGLDIAVLNAGITGPNIPLEDYELEDFDRVIAVNVRAVWLGMRAAIPHMKKRGGGSVMMTSSIQGLSAMPNTSGYTTSKHALVGMMKQAALELARDRIRVNTVHPGFSDTPMMQRIHESAVPENPKAVEDALSAGIPMRRYGSPEEIAALMLFLASDAASYCTGGTYTADGGLLASWGPTPH